MAWAAIIPAIASLAATAISSRKSSGAGSGGTATQIIKRKPSERTAESSKMWGAFMDELFGVEAQPERTVSRQVSTGGGGRQPSYRPPQTSTPEMPGSIPWNPLGSEWRGTIAGTPWAGGTQQVTETLPAVEGKPGLRERLEEQAAWLQPKLDEYKGILSDLMGNKGIGQGLLDPISFQLGEEGSPISFVSRPGRETIGLLQQLAGQRLSTDVEYPLHWEDLKYLDYMKDLAMQQEGMRYGVPSSTTTESLQLPQASLLSQLASAAKMYPQFKGMYDDIVGAIPQQAAYPGGEPYASYAQSLGDFSM
jgi:hypothetical protein